MARQQTILYSQRIPRKKGAALLALATPFRTVDCCCSFLTGTVFKKISEQDTRTLAPALLTTVPTCQLKYEGLAPREHTWRRRRQQRGGSSSLVLLTRLLVWHRFDSNTATTTTITFIASSSSLPLPLNQFRLPWPRECCKFSSCHRCSSEKVVAPQSRPTLCCPPECVRSSWGFPLLWLPRRVFHCAALGRPTIPCAS